MLEFLPPEIWLFSVLIHSLSFVQASQRVLNQSHTGSHIFQINISVSFSRKKNKTYSPKTFLKCKKN